MIVRFENEYLENLYCNQPLKGKPKYSNVTAEKFKKTVLVLKAVSHTQELSKFRSLNFEPLIGDKTGLFSVRVDLNWRLEFRIIKEVLEIISITELSKHYQ